VQQFKSYQQCTRYRTTRETLIANISETDQPIDKRKTALWTTTFPRSVKTIWWTLVHLRKNDLDLWLMTLKLSRVREVVKVHVCAEYHQAQCSGSWVIVLTNLFALSRNGEKSENPVLWPWPLTYDLEILWGSCGCQGTCFCKSSSS